MFCCYCFFFFLIILDEQQGELNNNNSIESLYSSSSSSSPTTTKSLSLSSSTSCYVDLNSSQEYLNLMPTPTSTVENINSSKILNQHQLINQQPQQQNINQNNSSLFMNRNCN